jgi:hypothetical protein
MSDTTENRACVPKIRGPTLSQALNQKVVMAGVRPKRIP